MGLLDVGLLAVGLKNVELLSNPRIFYNVMTEQGGGNSDKEEGATKREHPPISKRGLVCR